MSSILWVAFIFWLAPDGSAHSSISPHIFRSEAACLKEAAIDVEGRPEMYAWGDCMQLPGYTS